MFFLTRCVEKKMQLPRDATCSLSSLLSDPLALCFRMIFRVRWRYREGRTGGFGSRLPFGFAQPAHSPLHISSAWLWLSSPDLGSAKLATDNESNVDFRRTLAVKGTVSSRFKGSIKGSVLPWRSFRSYFDSNSSSSLLSFSLLC